MAQLDEAMLAMITSHAGRANSTEWQIADRHMLEDVIDGDPATGSGVQEFIHFLFVLRENVSTKGLQ